MFAQSINGSSDCKSSRGTQRKFSFIEKNIMKVSKLSNSNRISNVESKIDNRRNSFKSERDQPLRKPPTKDQDYEDALDDYLVDDCSDALDEIR